MLYLGEECKNSAEKDVLTTNFPLLTSRLENDLSSAAYTLKKYHYLSDGECSSITSARSDHITKYMSLMLDEIGMKIESDPSNWKVFIEDVLGEMTPSAFFAIVIRKLGMYIIYYHYCAYS